MNLELPEYPVPDRVAIVQRLEPFTKRTYAELDGPGCIRHIWVTMTRQEPVSRKAILRIFFDDEPVPYVEVPVGDFFGVMHGKTWYPVNTPFLSVKAESGYNSYFPMPFGRSARIEFETGDEACPIYLMVDWHRYPGTEFKERRRFCARWRREFPARRYGDDFLMLDADGPGQFIGFVYGIRLLDDTDRWSHGGADNIYLDGEGQQPAFLRGIGGEDVFGASYGGALHPPETHLYAAMPYYVHEDVGQARPAHRLVGYRFFDPDPIPFQESIHARFGSMSNDICATTYWYSEKPVRPFFRLPPWDRLAFLPRHFSERDASRELPQGTSDLPLPASGEWWLCGPFGNAGDRSMNQELPAETLLQPDQVMDGMHEDRSPWLNSASREAGRDKARWLKRPAVHGFIDFNHLFRPIDRGAAPTHPGVAVARCILLSPHETTCQLQLAWDDRLILRVNDRPPVDLGHHAAFRKRTVDVPLRAGPNTLVIKLSNTRGTNHGGWAFALLARTSDGTRLLPRADDYAHPRPEVPPH